MNAPGKGVRPLYWSIRREVWENRSLYLAPLAVTALVLLAMLFRIPGLPGGLERAMDLAQQHRVAMKAFRIAPAPIMAMTFLVGMFYSLDALFGERRDRSILFWKSLPVSDLTTVAAKALVPLVVLPLIAFALSLGTIALLLIPTTAVMVAKGVSPGPVWAEVVLQHPWVMLYGLAVHALWFAPLHGYFLLISAWARRTPFLWAVLPPVALAVVERIVFQTSYIRTFMRYRVMGAMAEAFVPGPPSRGDVNRVMELDPLRFLASPGLWLGLLAAGLFFVATVRLRRNREPI